MWSTRFNPLTVMLMAPLAFAQNPVNLDTGVKGSRMPSYATDSGSANAYALTTIAPLGPGLRAGSCFKFIAAHANTSASTAVIDGGSTISIKRSDGTTALTANDIVGLTEICYDGTIFRLFGGSGSLSGLGGTLGCSQMPTLTGDVSNSSCAITVLKIQGRAVANISPSNNDILTWVAANSDWEPMAGGGGGTTTITTVLGLGDCTTDQTGNSSYLPTSMTTGYDAGWHFIAGQASAIYCAFYIPHALAGTPNGKIVLDIRASDNVSGHTANFTTSDCEFSSSGSWDCTFTAASAQAYTTTSTHWSNVRLTFNIQSTLAADGLMRIKIATSTTGTQPTSDMVVTVRAQVDQTL